MKKLLLTILTAAAAILAPSVAMAELPEYTTPTAPNNGDGNHYGVSKMEISINGELAVTYETSTAIENYFNDDTKFLNVSPGDVISFKPFNGEHLKWSIGVAYVDWNADGTFDESTESYTIFNDPKDACTQESGKWTYTGCTTITVPTTAINGAFAIRFVSGEAPAYNTKGYGPNKVPRRGKAATLRINCTATQTIYVPQASEFEGISALTLSTADGTLTAGETASLLFNTPVTINATPADGYFISSITVAGQAVNNGETFNLTSNIAAGDIVITTTSATSALTVNCDEALTYTLTQTSGAAIDDLTAIPVGTPLKLVISAPITHTVSTVKLNDNVIEAVDGAYLFAMPNEASTLSITAQAKATYTLTIAQPQFGSITVSRDGVELTDGATLYEGDVLTFANQPCNGHFVAYTVNDADIEGDTYTVTSDVKVTANMPEGCVYPIVKRTFSGSANQQNRYLKSITTEGTETPIVFNATTTDELPFTNYTGSANTYYEAGALIDKTANPIVVIKGTESFTFNLVQWTDPINGHSTELGWTDFAYFVDWNRDGDFYDENESIAAPTNNTHNSTQFQTHSQYTQTIPANVGPGTYRMRLVFHEDESTGYNWTKTIFDEGKLRNGVAYDLDIVIQRDCLDEPRTVTVATANEDHGTVAITTPETEGNSVTTDATVVTIEATAADGYTFLNWTDANNQVVNGAGATYNYRGETDATFTAHFGHTVTYGANVIVTANGQGLVSGQVVAPNTEITLTVNSSAIPSGKEVIVTVNGTAVELTEEYTCTLTLDQNVEINVQFVDKVIRLSILVSGEGQVEVWEGCDANNENLPAGAQYVDGAVLPTFTNTLEMPSLIVFLIPEDGKQAESATYSCGNGIQTATLFGMTAGFDVYKKATTRVFEIPKEDITDNLEINALFSEDTAGIENIGIDEANGPVEYYNLQGIRVAAENLTPGFYIVRHGDKTTKALIRK